MTPSRLCFLCCHNFTPEVGAGVTAEGWNDVAVASFPARCGRPPVSWDELHALLPADCTQVVALGRACLAGLDPAQAPAGFPALSIDPLRQCFHLVAGERLVDEAIAGGAYLITPAWLADWRGQLAMLGFKPEQAGAFFQDFAKALLLLDTALDPQTPARFAELQAALDLPALQIDARRLVVGIDTTRARLVRHVLEWRLAQQRQACAASTRHHAGELADHVAAMDMLAQLARTQHEDQAIGEIESLCQMLFAPAALYYLRVENGVPIPLPQPQQQAIPETLQAALNTLREGVEDHAWTPDGQGFLLRIGHAGKTLGLIAVERLAFPEYRERYLNLALAISGVCGLAIENARNRRRLLEAEKMASLGIVVAGVAHEINTPLGVGMTAISSLQAQAQQLAERFAARSMTQSDLLNYLQRAGQAGTLIRNNLERIGHLTDAFRQVAVHGQPVEKKLFRLRECLDSVIQSLGERLDPARVVLQIDCDPALEIDSVASDWVSIFINLIGNSLKHGFKGRNDQGGRESSVGHIAIRVERSEHALRIRYEDDGVGLSPEAQARIFEPFYTTDMQHGMGLGMHLVYNLITHRLGGSIQCESPPGQGVRFHIEIPQ